MAGQYPRQVPLRLFAPLLTLALAPTSALAAPTVKLGRGAWSWFGDPRAVHSGGTVFAGWINRAGNVRVASWRGGRVRAATIKRGLGRDDHNDPSLVVRRDGRITAFFSPHSGRHLPPPGIPSRLYWRTTRRPGDVRSWGPLHRLRTNTPGGLGYTYPNPIALRGRTWLFWRGGNWQPSFSTSRGGRRWTRARTLLRGPGANRPYAKYAASGGDTIHIAYTEGNPSSYPAGIRYARMRRGGWRGAGGRLIARMSGLPFAARRGQRVYAPRTRGRAWVFDVAAGRGGRPVIAYVTYPSARRPLYRYAVWTGRRWRNNDIVRAGPPIAGSYAAGMSLDHEDPSVVYLSRKVDGDFEVERWVTPDGGRSWSHAQVTHSRGVDNIRPVAPRGIPGGRGAVVWLRGRYPGYRNYLTTVTTLRSFPRAPIVDLAHAPAA